MKLSQAKKVFSPTAEMEVIPASVLSLSLDLYHNDEMKLMRLNVKNERFLTEIVQLCFPVRPEVPFFLGKWFNRELSQENS